MSKFVAVLLFLGSVLCLVPGLTEPLITIEATVEKQEILELTAQAMSPEGQPNGFVQKMLQSVVANMKVEGTVRVFSSTRSLLGTMEELITHGHRFVGVLIGLFGVVIPVIKILMTVLSAFLGQAKFKTRLLGFSSALGKWSMSDVFVMALMVAFLAINANEDSINTVQMSAELGAGFYFFVGYCLLAIAAGQLLQRQAKGKLA